MSANVTLIQGAILTAVLATFALLGYDWTPSVIGVTVVAMALLLAWRATPDSEPHDGQPHWWDWRVFASIAAVGVVPSLLDLRFTDRQHPLGPEDPTDQLRRTILGMNLAAAAAMAGMYVSSTVDWFYVGPRLRGGPHRRMPCESSGHRTWRRVTRVWWLHRLFAVLFFTIGLVVLVAFSAYRWLDDLGNAIPPAIAAAATVVAGFYLRRSPAVLALALFPPLHVGDKVELAEPFNVEKSETWPTYYVVDVGMEGVRLLRLTEQDRSWARERHPDLPAPEHDRLVDTAEVSSLVRSRSPLKPCRFAKDCREVHALCPHRRLVNEQLEREQGR